MNRGCRPGVDTQTCVRRPGAIDACLQCTVQHLGGHCECKANAELARALLQRDVPEPIADLGADLPRRSGREHILQNRKASGERGGTDSSKPGDHTFPVDCADLIENKVT